MKPLTMLGLAALTALLATAVAGAPSAMAETTSLCTADESPCAEGNLVTHVHEATLAGSPAILLSSLGAVECSVLFLGEVLGTGAPLVVHGNFTYSNCLRSGNACTVTELNGPAEIAFLKESTEKAKVTGEAEINFHCGIFINCTYNSDGLISTAQGALLSLETNGSVSLTEQAVHKVSGICPSTAKLDITTTPLSATYIAGLNPDPMECVSRTRGLYDEGSLYVCKKDDSENKGAYVLIGD